MCTRFPQKPQPPLKLEVTFCVRGIISPLLANLFLHYAFDVGMRSRYPQLPFERDADDAIVHCRTEMEAQEVRAAIVARMDEVVKPIDPVRGMILHEEDGTTAAFLRMQAGEVE